MKSPTGVAYWLVGAYDSDARIDKSAEYIEAGAWVNGYRNRYLDQVRLMKVGDKIAIKAAHTQKSNLPFENHGLPVSVMSIKAIGTITENQGDGRNIRVEWKPLSPFKKWYFYTYQKTVWKLSGEVNEYMGELIDFVFSDVPQDIEKFRNEPFWRERFGDIPKSVPVFAWTTFYEDMADALLKLSRIELN